MSAISGLPSMPTDNTVAAGAPGRSGRGPGDKSGFSAIMADVAAVPTADSSVRADASRIAKAVARAEAVSGKSALPPPDGEPPQSAIGPVTHEMRDRERKADRKAAPAEDAGDRHQGVAISAIAANVDLATVLPIPSAVAGSFSAADQPKDSQAPTPRPIKQPTVGGELTPAEVGAVSLRVATVQSDIEPAAPGEIALRVVGQSAARPADAAPREKAPFMEAAAPARVVTATVLQTETHLALPRPPGREQANAIADADPEDNGGGNVPAAGRVGRAEALEHRHPAFDAESGMDHPSPDGRGRAAPVSLAVDAAAPTATGTSPLSTPLSDNIVAAVEHAVPATPATAVTAPAAGAPAPLQAMTVRLDLPEHGRIDVRVTSRAGAVSLHLTAERDETARKLGRERDAVVASLRDAGYDADIRAITTQRMPEAPETRGAQASPQSASNGGASDQPGTHGSPSGSRHPHRDGGAPPSQREPHANHLPDDRRTGGIYV